MKVIYYSRVVFISYEFVSLLASLIAYLYFEDTMHVYVQSISINEEGMKWVVLYPMGIATWMLKEGISIIFPSEETNQILHKWDKYWMLKAHFNIGIFYAIILTIPCLYLWLTSKLVTSWGISIFSACALAISLAAFSFYGARIKVKELLIQADKSSNN